MEECIIERLRESGQEGMGENSTARNNQHPEECRT
jgi:hypothetical protein